MAPRVFAAVLFASLATSCVPRHVDTNFSDLDGDGIPDARDRCMADPEDFDGFEDDDGCAEGGGPPEQADAAPLATPELEVSSRSIRKVGAQLFQAQKRTASITKYQAKAGEAVVDQDERALVVLGFGKSWVKTASKTTKIRGDVHGVSFAPNGKHVALIGDREFLVLSVASGKTVRRFPYAPGTSEATETKGIKLGNDESLVFFDGCQLRKGAVGSSATAPLGAAHCGARPLVSRNGTRWFVRQETEESVVVNEIDVQSGEERLVLGGTGNAPGLSIFLTSPNGEHLCFSRNRDGSALTCRNLKTLHDVRIWQGSTDKRAAFSEGGLLAFGAGPLRAKRDLYVADLDQRTMYIVGELGPRERWLNPVGANGFIASGGNRLRHFDLQTKRQTDIHLGDGEWEGFAAIPGTSSKFFVGKERKATRDLYRVTLP